MVLKGQYTKQGRITKKYFTLGGCFGTERPIYRTSYNNKNIFHFWRVFWSWKANTFIQADRTSKCRIGSKELSILNNQITIVSIPYMAIATRTRSKGLQESSNEKEFQDFLNEMVTSVKDDDTSSASYTTSSSSSSSSSSYYWSGESPDSVVPGSTSSDGTSTVTFNHV